MKKLTNEDAKILAIKRGGKCLSEYISNKTKMEWSCKKHHKWYASYNNIARGHWCPYCAGLAKHTIEYMKQMATKNNGKCLSEKYINANTKLCWECIKEHRWFARPADIINGHWCPECARVKKLSLEYFKNLAIKNKGRCLSKSYNGIFDVGVWECSCGNVWKAQFKDIKDGTWCPICNFPGKTQKLLVNIIKQIYAGHEVLQNFKEFDWLRTVKHGKQELDIYIPDLRIAIEYDGEQHFKPMRYKNKKKMLEKLNRTKYLDKLKNKKIKQHRDDIKYFIRFSYKDKIDKENIIIKLKEEGILK